MCSDVSDFFDREADEYHGGRRRPMASYHRETAKRIQAEVHGEVLSIGGLWAQADLAKTGCHVTVVDLSTKMLEHYAKQVNDTVQADARELPFRNGTFNHAVLPLVLHHVTDSSGWAARANVRKICSEAARVLRRPGRIWISELCVPRVVYAVELTVSPLTRIALAAADIPLVVMHSAKFLESTLHTTGFRDIRVERIVSEEAHASDWLQPIIGLPWLRIPRFAYPVVPTLISARW